LLVGLVSNSESTKQSVEKILRLLQRKIRFAVSQRRYGDVL